MPQGQVSRRKYARHLVFLSCMTAFVTPCFASPKGPVTPDYFVFYPLVENGRDPLCSRPYTLTVFADGRVVYNGLRCVRELGSREYRVPANLAKSWVARMIESPLLQAASVSANPVADTQTYEIELVTKAGRNRVRTIEHGESGLGEAPAVLREAVLRIDPLGRWACHPGPNCFKSP
jgi:hypothetical protein